MIPVSFDIATLRIFPNCGIAGAIHTEGGALIITQTQEPIHDLNFKSGMLQGWNKVCFWGSMYFEGGSRRRILLVKIAHHRLPSRRVFPRKQHCRGLLAGYLDVW
jgi:hypothetical protein